MNYYRRLPIDVRVAMFISRHGVRFGIAACATCAAGMLTFIGWLVLHLFGV